MLEDLKYIYFYRRASSESAHDIHFLWRVSDMHTEILETNDEANVKLKKLK